MRIALSLLLLSGIGCGGPEDTASTPQATQRAELARLHVVRRLGPADFGLEASAHRPMGAIEGVARPVIRALDAQLVASVLTAPPDASGRVVAEISLTEDLQRLPDDAFGLRVQGLPGAASDEMLEQIAKVEGFVIEVSTGWSLERRAGLAIVEYRPDASHKNARYRLSLVVNPPDRLQVVSVPFEAPDGAVLELAYAVAPSAAGGDSVARFAARLRCGDAEPTVLLDVNADAGSRRWHELSVPLPGGSCQLGLEATGPEGGPVRGALWALPRVLGRAPALASAPNLVIVSLDTLRADHVSGYGYPRPTTPRIDADLIARGTTFGDVTTTYSRTDVSHMSMMTGLYPSARPHPGRLHRDTPMPMLAERLADAGFQTAAFAEDGLFAGAFGFWFGFDRFVERTLSGPSRGVTTVADARAWLRDNAKRRFFLFVHTYKTHAPYAASAQYGDLFRDPAEWEREGMSPIPERHRGIADEYDRTIREADDLVGTLLDELEALGLAEDTLVVLTSDHGEAFGEHGILGHSMASQQEVMRVPLVLRGPGVPAGLLVDTPVSLVDLAPTLTDLLALEPMPSQGISLRPALEGEALPEKRALFFSWYSWQQQWGEGVRYGPWKYEGRGAGGKAFNLEEDPGERSGRFQPRSSAYIRRLLEDHAKRSAEIRASLSPGGAIPSVDPISTDLKENLRALGYLE